ncbi:sensor histidine kinase [Parablautia muri]|uniref:GHKL domain-containing protein n=1 Tax=Parablautia muri TaxID=2320879 RepID=A0A9X5BGT5_9FIRM|nr:GHKL domain-containing protein [Parablautia muri]NBJ93784.1 GHKL domain-containing protein [Parablautia muri]
MITNICLLLEVLTIVFCVHALYGEKFRLDISTVSFLATYMIILTMVNYYELPQQYTLIMYPIMFIYCGIRFEFKIACILINMVLCIIIVGSIQMVVSIPFLHILGLNWFENYRLLFINCFAFVLVTFLLPKCKISRIMNFLHSKEKIENVILIICIVLIAFLLFRYKEANVFFIDQAMLLFISIVCTLILADQVGKYKIKTKEVETELKMHKLYADSFQGLIENIRLRQHEFDNHINTIYSQHYIYDTYDELVKAQDTYCKIISKENQFNKLLKASNPIVAGFLYGKFMEIDKLGIDIDYRIKIIESNIEIPVYKVVEILGDLINNAVEAIEKTDGVNKLYVSLTEDAKLEIEVRNESPYIDYNEIDKFFVKGFSSKGKDRGLGLHNVKKICDEYTLNIYCENVKIDDANWLSFKVVKDKTSSYD